MLVNQARLDADTHDKNLRDATIRAEAVKRSADARQEIVEAAQFERGYN